MTRRLRSPSLFWTLAGAFLLVLVLATLLQAFVVGAVIRPIATRWAEDRAALRAREVATAIAAIQPEASRQEIVEILRLHAEESRLTLFFRRQDGELIVDRPIPPMLQRRLLRLLDREQSTPESGEPPSGPRMRRGVESRDRSAGAPGPGRERPWRDLRVMARHPAETPAGVIGEVIALAPVRPFPLWPGPAPLPVLLFLPVAVLLAGAAGLIMFRVLVRRLRALELLAARVAEGDLDARVADPGSDEIGRLSARLNHMTETLAEARRRVGESERQRRQLLVDVSHELATPLTSIRGYAETLLDPDVSLSPEERTTFMRSVLDEAKRMDLLTQDLFELTRLEAGASELSTERLDWASLCRNTITRFEPRFRKAGLSLRWQGPDDAAWIVADGRRLEQVLDNLLVNALRYVPAGGTVALSLEPVGPGSTRVRLTVTDDGPGFPPEDLPHVFDRFYRADPARSTGGTGLGLAIVQEIVRRHGGEVRAENRQPRGAAIVVELPADEAPLS